MEACAHNAIVGFEEIRESMHRHFVFSAYILFNLHVVFLCLKVSTQTFWPPRIQCIHIDIYDFKTSIVLKSS